LVGVGLVTTSALSCLESSELFVVAAAFVGERVECGAEVAISSVRPAMLPLSAVRWRCCSMTVRMVGSREYLANHRYKLEGYEKL
jgi:hypothetical protein